MAARLKANKFDATQTQFAQGQTLAMLFEKPSLRTRVTFEAGMNQLGGHAINLEGRLGQRETVPDVARNLDRWLDGIMARTFEHKTVLELAEYAHVPVINGLSDREHPCQAFADFQTLAERKGELKGLKLAYVGDGNNVAHSLIFAPFQVNAELVAHAKPDVLIMHCLPAHRGEEITADVIDGPHAVVFDQAENRLHAQKAVLALVL